MIKSGRESLVDFVVDAVEHETSLTTRRWAGRTLLHYASAADLGIVPGPGGFAGSAGVLGFGLVLDVESGYNPC